jgi:hypothetical protein
MATLYFGNGVAYYGNVNPVKPQRTNVKKSRPDQYGADVVVFAGDPQTSSGQAWIYEETIPQAERMKQIWTRLVSTINTLYLYDGYGEQTWTWMLLENARPQNRPTLERNVLWRGAYYPRLYKIRMQLNFSKIY